MSIITLVSFSINFKILKFNGEKDDNVKDFLTFVSYEFLPMAGTFNTVEEKDKVKMFLLYSNTGTDFITREWIKDQIKAIKESFTLLFITLLKWFPNEDERDLKVTAIKNLFKFKQEGWSLNIYFEKMREIKRNLLKSLHNELLKWLINRLADSTIRCISQAMIPRSELKELKGTIQIIEEVNNEDNTSKQEKKSTASDNY